MGKLFVDFLRWFSRKYTQNSTHIDLTCFLKIINGNSVDGLLLVIHTTIASKKKSTLLCNIFSKNESYEERKVVENESGAQRAR